MATKKDVKWDKLNDYITYRIIDSTLYLIEKDDYINDDSWKLICKKIKLLIEDNNILYILSLLLHIIKVFQTITARVTMAAAASPPYMAYFFFLSGTFFSSSSIIFSISFSS